MAENARRITHYPYNYDNSKKTVPYLCGGFSMRHLAKATVAACIGLCLVGMHAYADDGVLTNSEFLTWGHDQQEFYIHTAVSMTRLVVGQTSPKQGDCIVAWYSADRQAAIDYVIEIMRKNQQFDPRSAILAVMEQKCGQFAYREK
jgi:hypothetical protein